MQEFWAWRQTEHLKFSRSLRQDLQTEVHKSGREAAIVSNMRACLVCTYLASSHPSGTQNF